MVTRFWFLALLAPYFLLPTLGFGQIAGSLGYLQPETLSASAGVALHVRTLDNGESKETTRQWAFPLLATGFPRQNLHLSIYQAASTAELADGPNLRGIGNTRLRGVLRLLDNRLTAYLGLSLPVVGTTPDADTTRLSNLLYNETLDMGVPRVSEGVDAEIGLALAESFGKFSFGFGAGATSKGSYDRFSTADGPVNYDPGNLLNLTTGLYFRGESLHVRARALYLRYGEDELSGNEIFQSGNELSLQLSTTIPADPLILSVFVTDTIKGEGRRLGGTGTVANLFDNRLHTGIALACPLLADTLVLKVDAWIKRFFLDGKVNARTTAFELGGQVLLSESWGLEAFTELLTGDMDAGSTNISGLGLGFTVHYGF